MTELDLVSLKADLLAGLDQRLRQGVRIGDGPGRTMRRRLRPAGTISDTLKVRFPSQLNANVMASFIHLMLRNRNAGYDPGSVVLTREDDDIVVAMTVSRPPPGGRRRKDEEG